MSKFLKYIYFIINSTTLDKQIQKYFINVLYISICVKNVIIFYKIKN